MSDIQNFALDPLPARQASDALYDFLKDAQGKPVRIDGAEVQQLSARQLQHLVSAKKQWAANDHAFAVAPASDGFRTALTLLGVADDHFDDEVKS